MFSSKNAAQRCMIRRKRRITAEEQRAASREADPQHQRHHQHRQADRSTAPAAQKAPFLVPPGPKQTAKSNSASKTGLVRLSSGQKGPPEAFQQKGCMAARAAYQRRPPGTRTFRLTRTNISSPPRRLHLSVSDSGYEFPSPVPLQPPNLSPKGQP